MPFAQKLRLAEEHLSKVDRKLATVIEANGPCRLKPHRNYYGELVSNIVGQQLSTKAAHSIWQRVLGLFDGKTPTPEQLIKVNGQRLRDVGLSWNKVAYVKDIAAHIIDGRLDMDHIQSLPNDQLIKQLTSIKGIGEWSSHMFMMFSLGRLDVLPVGDFGIKKAVQRLYGLKTLPGPAEIVAIANKNKWHPYESVASWYLWQSLDNSPGKQTRHDY